MKVGFLFLHPFSESLGSTTRVLEIAKALNRRGFEIVIFNPYEKTGFFDGIRIKNVRLPLYLRFARIKLYDMLRVIYYNKLMKRMTVKNIFENNILFGAISSSLTKLLLEEKVDVLIIEQDFAIVPGLKAAKKAGISAIVDLHNITAEELVAAGIIDYNYPGYHEMQAKLGSLLKEAQGIIVVSEALAEYVEKQYNVNSNKIILVPPAGKPRVTKIPPRRPPYKLIYAGLIAYRERVDLFVRSLPYLRKSGIEFEIFMTKKGEELKKIKKLAKRMGIEINFFWFKNREKLFRLMANCHVGILTSSDDMARKLGPPIKLYDYLSVGLPVVGNNIGGWSKIIEKEGIGVLTDSSPESFAEGILRIIENEETYYKYAKRALTILIEKYNWDRVIEPLVKFIENIK